MSAMLKQFQGPDKRKESIMSRKRTKADEGKGQKMSENARRTRQHSGSPDRANGVNSDVKTAVDKVERHTSDVIAEADSLMPPGMEAQNNEFYYSRQFSLERDTLYELLIRAGFCVEMDKRDSYTKLTFFRVDECCKFLQLVSPQNDPDSFYECTLPKTGGTLNDEPYRASGCHHPHGWMIDCRLQDAMLEESGYSLKSGPGYILEGPPKFQARGYVTIPPNYILPLIAFLKRHVDINV